MNRFAALLLVSISVPAWATTYTIRAGSSAATMQSIINTAGASTGNTVAFSAGDYHLTETVTLPCSHGTVYTGPNVGVVTQTNLPTATLSSNDPTNYAFSTNSNSTSLTGAQGCLIEYLRFTGIQGGILVYYPASGITIQQNAFDNNDPPAGGESSEANIFLTGENWNFTPATGVSYITIVWNTFFNNCAAIRAVAWPDSGGYCASTWVDAFNDHLTWSNNTVNLTEEGLKLSQQTIEAQGSKNADVENNNMQGNSRILIEAQQDTNGVGIYSHNAFYQPFNPSYNTFELSIPEWIGSLPPTHTVTDNVMIGNVPVTIGGSGAHYGIGLELWGAGSIATNNLFQGGNGEETCEAGWGCSGWGITVGGTFTNANITGNYFSGTDVWLGSPTVLDNAVTYEQDATSANAGLVLSANTVARSSSTIPTTAPAIAVSGNTVTLSDSDSKHRLSIFYTTDGSTPVRFGPGGSAGSTRVYTAPFTVAAGTTVKAMASWGQGANQGIVFPVFGYVPSSVVTAVAGNAAGTGSGAAGRTASGRSVVSAYLQAKGNANSMKTGSTLQFTAHAIYSDGTSGALPDALGNKVTAWNTSNHRIAKVSTQGHVTAVGTGAVQVQAMVGPVPASPWVVMVGATPNAAAQVASPAKAYAEVQAAAQGEAALASTAQSLAQEPAMTGGAAVAGTGQLPSAGGGAGEPSSSGGGGSEPASAGGGGAGEPPSAGAGATPAAGGGAVVTSGPAPSGPGPAMPDTFLGPFWRLVRPAGGSASISQAHLFLGVPGGANHDALRGGNQAVRVVQAIGRDDFDVAIKIDSPLFATDAGTSQGLMVLADSKNFLTFALATDGNRIGLTAHTVAGGVVSTVLDDRDFSQYQNPMYLRLSRSGTAWVALYSIDGVSWTQAAAFAGSSASGWVGPFASNYSDTPANAVPVVMSVNWFDVLQ